MSKRTHALIGASLACVLGVGCTDLADTTSTSSNPDPARRVATLGNTPAPTSRYVILQGPSAIDRVRALDLVDAEKRKLVKAYAADLRKRHAELRPQLEALGATIVSDLVLVANAFQVVVPDDRLGALAKLPGVARLEKPTVYTRSLAAAVPLVGAPSLWQSASGYTGEGMRIGIIDTGVDYNHAALGGSGVPADYTGNDPTLVESDTFPTDKVIGGRDFAGDDYDPLGVEGPITPTPDDDPRDCAGHGTHVAAIAAGTGVTNEGTSYEGSFEVSLDPQDFMVYPGAAPEASIFALKIFGCLGSTNVTLGAFELAVDPDEDDDIGDRLDVVNLSLGSSFAQAAPLEHAAVANLTEAGALVVAAAGNDGFTPFTVAFPASSPSALAVGMTNKVVEEQVWPGLQVTAPPGVVGTYPTRSPDVGPAIAELGAYTGQLIAGTPILGCEAFTNAASLADKIVLVRRGACPYATKDQNASAAGARAIVVVDNSPAEIPNGSAGTYTLPMFHLRQADGEALIAAAPVDIAMRPDLEATISLGPDYLIGLSSRGPTADRMLNKPDLSAPGFFIASALVGTGFDGVELSGTSMASPLVAGAAALLRQARPSLTPFEVKARLASSTAPILGGLGNAFPAASAGSGRLDLEQALVTTITAREDGDEGQLGVSFGAILAVSTRTETRTVVVENSGVEVARLDLAVEQATEWPGLTVEVTPTSIEVPAGGSATFQIALTVDPALLPKAPAYQLYATPVSFLPDTSAAGRRDAPAVLFTAASGRVLLTPSEGEDPVAMVGYHGVARAAAARTTGALSGCVGPTGGSAMLDFEGTPAHHDNATSILELGTTESTFEDTDGTRASADIVATGSYVDSGSERLFFGVVTAGDWVTPTQSFLSLVGFELDTNDDQEADFLVVVESFEQPDPTSYVHFPATAPSTRVIDLATGESPIVPELINGVYAAYPNNAFIDSGAAHETHIFFNQVLVLPVRFASIGLNTQQTKVAYRGVSMVSRLPYLIDLPADAPLDTTDWVELDTNGARLAISGCVSGTPLCVDNEGPVAMTIGDGTDAPSKLLVLHHGNGGDPRHERHEIVELAAGELTNNLTLTATSGEATEVGAEVGATFTVTASGARDEVSIIVDTSGGTLVSLTPSVGSCADGTCELGSLAAGSSATIEVKAMATAAGTLGLTGSVGSTPACESNTADDSATASFEVTAIGPEPEPNPEVTEPNPESSKKGSDSGCGSTDQGLGSVGSVGLIGVIGLLALAMRRRLDAQRRLRGSW